MNWKSKLVAGPAVNLVVMVMMFAASVTPVRADGESDGTFPAWEERWIHQLINRARSDPQYEMDACGDNCPDAGCYSQTAPLPWKTELNRAGRFHSTTMTLQGFFSHTSACTLAPNIDDLYPESCDGSASCACVGGTMTCQPTCTSMTARVNLFGSPFWGEVITSTFGGPNSAFYLWLHEPTLSDACQFTVENGHRWLILKSTGAVGVGRNGNHYTGDFGTGTSPGQIPSGSHYPQQDTTVEIWANWQDESGPSTAAVNVGGSCHAMTLERGTSTNGAWKAEVTNVGSGCHRYYFVFEDSLGIPVTFPTTGSLAIGSGAECPNWEASRPVPCGVSETIFFDGFEAFADSSQ